LLSYWLLRGRCRDCGTHFSSRYFFIELFTGLAFAGLFHLEVLENIHQWPVLQGQRQQIEDGMLPAPEAWVVFGFHAVLACYLIVATFCDLDHREIPLTITVPGTVLGLIGAVLWPWPWPWSPEAAAIAPRPPGLLFGPNLDLKMGLYPWPVWAPLPDWLPAGSWQLGLATGVAGLLVGTLMLRTIRALFGMGLGVEALGLGDADLMMMAGSFLGWQPVVVAFFIGVFAGLFFGIGQLILRGDNALPFGPALAIGIVVVMLYWHNIGPDFELLFFNGYILVALVIASCVLMLLASYLLRLLRLMRGESE
jgi:leader peptidase (prepilin peptidase)/N-methyltransferase